MNAKTLAMPCRAYKIPWVCFGIVFASSMSVHGPASAQADRSTVNAVAVREFLSSLDEPQRERAVFAFRSHERLNWNFVPMRRAGVPLSALSAEQRPLVEPMLRSALSEQGLAKAKSIMDHESILAPLERERGVVNWRRRDPGLYYTSVFGDPAPNATWAWRFEGHHLSLNVTQVEGEPQIVAPVFMGANPARVPSGPHAGLRILAEEEDVARALVRMLPSTRKARAVISDEAFDDILSGNDPKVEGLALEGLPAAEMSAAEQARLRELVQLYVERLAHTSAQEQLQRIERAGFEQLHFAWAGSMEPGEPHYYRVHGPTLLIEYDNTQNDANHVHSVWRDLERDFGGDLLRKHLAHHH